MQYNEVTDTAGDSLCVLFEGMVVTPQPTGKGGKPNSSSKKQPLLDLKSIDLSMNQFSSKLEIRLEKALKQLIPNVKV